MQIEQDGRKLELDSPIVTVGMPMDVSFQEVPVRYLLPTDEGSEVLRVELAEGPPAPAAGEADATRPRQRG